mgnify:CR=1 FL=1
MINPLNELSSVYVQSIAEGCDEKKDCNSTPIGEDCPTHGKKMCPPTDMKGSGSVDGGDAAKPGKDKNYVKPMATEGHCAVDGVECSPTEKKKDAKRMKKESAYSNWRDDSQDLLEVIGGAYGGVAGVDNERNLENPKAKKASKSSEKITEKSVKNKIIINPPQGMKEAFAELGGVITEMYEITEKIDIDKADMGDVIKDFRKSDAPQFKGKSDKKKQQMAIAAKLATEETEEETEEEEMLAKTKEHDDKQSGKMAEAYYGGEEQRKKDERKAAYEKQLKKMLPKRGFDQMGREIDPRSGKVLAGESALAGVLSTIRAKNGMGTVTAKGADKLQAKKEKTMGEEMSIKDQMRISREAAAKRKPYQPGDREKQRAAQIRQMAKNASKDTRTDAQKMTDATGPRPGSNYRGD